MTGYANTIGQTDNQYTEDFRSMPELLLHYIWQSGLFRTLPQHTTDGRRVEVLEVGKHNLDAGPDFFSATIRIDGMTWTGNVEIHVKSSDWVRHGHQHDAAYDNVILHVVKQADRDVFNSKGETLVQCELQYPDDPDLLKNMLSDRTSVCSQKLLGNPELISSDWQLLLLRDRMMKKNAAVTQLLMLYQNAWDQAFYVTLAHNFGFHTNGLPFELLAKQTPLACLQKHRNSLFQIEAILFGQSGLLTAEIARDEYARRLWKEYCFLQKKFGLQPISGAMWKMLRMRPQNFPHVRIAQFAALLHRSEFLLSQLLMLNDPKQIRPLFDVQVSDYWQQHYHFGDDELDVQKSKKDDALQGNLSSNMGNLGRSAVDILIINSVVPYQYAWGKAHLNKQMQDDALQLLRSISAEKNSIVAQWKLLGIPVRTAADSQALIHLYQEYCMRQRCLSCDVGYQIFTPQVHQ
ncbi:MAG: DUF2851 family protein [Paludibacteraceae bacterium]|nr:DUF2851 family protein [Paludibacteraceae bacterium]